MLGKKGQGSIEYLLILAAVLVVAVVVVVFATNFLTKGSDVADRREAIDFADAHGFDYCKIRYIEITPEITYPWGEKTSSVRDIVCIKYNKDNMLLCELPGMSLLYGDCRQLMYSLDWNNETGLSK